MAGKSTKPSVTAANESPRKSSSRLSKRETELLGRISTGLSEARARRLTRLDALRRDEVLKPEEHAELLGLVDESERLAESRAGALSSLPPPPPESRVSRPPHARLEKHSLPNSDV